MNLTKENWFKKAEIGFDRDRLVRMKKNDAQWSKASIRQFRDYLNFSILVNFDRKLEFLKPNRIRDVPKIPFHF